jgi:flagellar biosynthesis component FlhA
MSELNFAAMFDAYLSDKIDERIKSLSLEQLVADAVEKRVTIMLLRPMIDEALADSTAVGKFINDKIAELDIDAMIREAIADEDLQDEDDVKCLIDNHDFEEAIKDALRNEDLSDQVCDAVRNDSNVKEVIEDVVRNFVLETFNK